MEFKFNFPIPLSGFIQKLKLKENCSDYIAVLQC